MLLNSGLRRHWAYHKLDPRFIDENGTQSISPFPPIPVILQRVKSAKYGDEFRPKSRFETPD